MRYSRASSAAASINPDWGQLAPSVAAPAAVAKKPRSKVKIAAAVVVVLVAIAAVGGGKNDVPPSAQAPTVASDGERWGDFRAWVLSDLQAMSDALSSMSERALAGDAAGTMEEAANMEAIASRLLVYLSNHPAATCYSGVQADVSNALSAYQSAGAAGSSGDFDSAANDMKRGTRSLSLGTDGIPAAAEACTS